MSSQATCDRFQLKEVISGKEPNQAARVAERSNLSRVAGFEVDGEVVGSAAWAQVVDALVETRVGLPRSWEFRPVTGSFHHVLSLRILHG